MRDHAVNSQVILSANFSITRSLSKLLSLALSLPLLSIQSFAFAPRLPNSKPAGVGVAVKRLAAIDRVVEEGISKRQLPGAVVLVARKGQVVWRKAYGSRAVEPTPEPMTANTIFDVAS